MIRSLLKKTKKVIVFEYEALGDIITTSGIFYELKKINPSCYVCCVVNRLGKNLLEKDPAIDEFYLLEKRNIKNTVNLIRFCRYQKFDLAICFTQPYFFLVSFLAKIPVRVGVVTPFFKKNIKKWFYIFLTHKIFKLKKENYYETFGKIVGSKILKPKIYSSTGKDKLCSFYNHLIIGIAPGGSRGEKNKPALAKRWDEKNYALLINYLSRRYNPLIVFFGDEYDNKIVTKIIKKLEKSVRWKNLCGTTSIGDLIKTLPHCTLFISNDSGLLHLASALNIRTIGIYGPSNPEKHGPLNKKHIAIWKKLPCSINCLCSFEPSDKIHDCNSFRCIKAIKVGEVIRIIKKQKLINNKKYIIGG